MSAWGRYLFAVVIIGFGIENIVCARVAAHALGPQYWVLPVIPWLPANPWLAWLGGAILLACGAGILFERTLRPAARALAILFFLCTVILEAPKYAPDIGSIPLRTIVFEPLSIACLAWLLAGPSVICRYLLAVSLIVFGVDHFLALGFIASLIPAWIPFHTFWVAFFGVAFIASALSIALNILPRPGAWGLGLMFAIWVVTLHLPRVLGLYNIPGAPTNPDEYSSLLIAAALAGGLLGVPWTPTPRTVSTARR